MAASSYLLVAFESTQATSLEAGLKYLVQSAAGSALILIGVALILAQTGSLSFSGVQQTRLSPGMLAAGALFVVGFGVKSALVPMHTWLPDAHAQAPGGISAMMSGVVIEAALVALLRLLTALAAPSWAELLMAAGALNMFVGNLLALQQTQVKRLLAYSSLSHMGYILLGVGIGLYSGQTEGTQGGLFHLLNHGMMKGLAFLVAGALLYALRPGSDDYTPLTIGDLGGAAQRYPFAALALSIALLGLGGLPPLAGFMSKWQIFVAGFATHNVWVIGLVVFAAFNSVLSLAYYMPLVNALYRRQPSRTVTQGSRLPLIMQIPCVLLTLAILVLGIWPSLSTWLTGPASNGLIKALGG
jgi:proton-translocating NADH-quinone oxidoreductase chain N